MEDGGDMRGAGTWMGDVGDMRDAGTWMGYVGDLRDVGDVDGGRLLAGAVLHQSSTRFIIVFEFTRESLMASD